MILVGTSGYDYPEWRNVFYPTGLPREEFLRYYASKFSTVEINNTFYRMPSDYQMRNMIKKSDGKLLFSLKATQVLTHEQNADWQKESEKFITAIRPLMQDKLLVSVLFQFPQSFHYEKDNRIYLDKLLESFNEIPCVVEFRQKEWFTPRVYDGLAKRNVGLCLCDLPSLKSLPTLVPVITSSTSYLRFHGRNAQNWYGAKGTNGSDRYKYLYSQQELTDSLGVIKSLVPRSKIVNVFFNNHPGGAAAVNAITLKELLNL